MIAVGRVDPDVVAVAAAAARQRERQAAVGRTVEAAVGDEHLIRVLRVDLHVDVVAGTADQAAVPAHDLPGVARIVRPPERALVGRLDEREHAVGLRRGDRDVDLPHRRLRQPRIGQPLPGRAAVARAIDPAAGAAAEHRPRVHHHFPRAGEHHVGVLRVHRQA